MLQHRAVRLLLPVLSGLILSFACPDWNVEACAWLWPAPLLLVIWAGADQASPPPLAKVSRWRRLWRGSRTFRLGWLAGLAFFFPSLSWVRHSSRVINGARGDEWMGLPVELMGWGAVIGLSGYLAVYFGLWTAFISTVGRPRERRLTRGVWWQGGVESLRCGIVGALAWVTLEWVRGWLFTGFGWNGIGALLHQNAVLIQAADLVGVTGLSFTPVFTALVVFTVIWRAVLAPRAMRWHFDLLTVVVLLGVQIVYGMTRLSQAEQKAADNVPLRVAMVQLNTPQVDVFTRATIVEDYRRYLDLTRLYTERSPLDLVVWPESALGLPVNHSDHEKLFGDLMQGKEFSLIAGGELKSAKGESQTGAALFHRGTQDLRYYAKIHLVPFGEYLPGRTIVPFLEATLGQVVAGDFMPGDKTEPLPLANAPVSVVPLVCFEDTVGDLARRFVRPEPQVLVNMTNDGWFLQSTEPHQHLINAMFRCIELRRPLIRAGNTGVTCVIDERGVTTASLRDPETGSHFIEGVLPATLSLPKLPLMTLYARWGDWFAKLALLASLVSLGWHAYLRRSPVKR